VQIKYGALNVTEYLAVRKCENGHNYCTLIKGYSLNNVYETRSDLIRDSRLESVWTNCEECRLNPYPLIRMCHMRFEI